MFKEETNELFNTDIEILLEEPSIEEENIFEINFKCYVHPKEVVTHINILEERVQLCCIQCTQIIQEVQKTQHLFNIQECLTYENYFFNKLISEEQQRKIVEQYQTIEKIKRDIQELDQISEIMKGQMKQQQVKFLDLQHELLFAEFTYLKSTQMLFNINNLKIIMRKYNKVINMTNNFKARQEFEKELICFFMTQKERKEKQNDLINMFQIKIINMINKIQQIQMFNKENIKEITYTINRLNNNQLIKAYQFETKLLSAEYLKRWLQIIKERQKLNIQQINQIFLASKDGLSDQKLIQKLQNNQNIFFIFKQKYTNYIFGAYIHGFFYINDKKYQKDEDQSSFIFSNNNLSIFELKDSNYAFKFTKEKPICFGKGPDLTFEENFQKGQCQLNNSYKQNMNYQQNKNWNKYLCGDEQFDIEEIEIYNIFFQKQG